MANASNATMMPHPRTASSAPPAAMGPTNATTDLPSSYTTDVYNVTTAPTGNATETCIDWIEAQNVLFQLSCLAFAVGFLVPFTLSKHVILSRVCLVVGALLVVMWSGAITCHQDVLLWNIVFCLINLGHCALWTYRNWPVSVPAELESVYVKVFRPLKMSRGQFIELTGLAQIKDLPNGATYSVEGATHIGEKLSILVSGRLKVTCDNLFLHYIEPDQFVDSVEYDALALDTEDGQTTSCFQVSIRAIEDSRLLTWETESLKEFLADKPYFASVITNLLGKDITHKLYQVHEMLLSHPQYIRVIANKTSGSYLRHNLQKYSPSFARRKPNGILRQTSPPDSASSAGSRNTASPTRLLMTSSYPRSPTSQLSFETSV